MNWLDYREKLGIGFHDKQKYDYFLVNIFNILDDSTSEMRGQINESEYFWFCSTTGTTMAHELLYGTGFEKIVKVLKMHTNCLEEFLSYYIAFVNCQQDNNYKKLKKEDFINILCNIMFQSQLPYELLTDGDGYFIFPKGAQEFDDALVSQPLEWLAKYPQAHKTFCIALKQYSDGIYIRDVADNLRKTLEAFFQEFLENSKNLETNKNEICKYLGLQNVDPGISGMFQPLINAYKNVNDRIAKHDDKVDKKLLEFLLYQTGIFIRMVIVVKQAEQEETSNAD